jgi:hypothetical protein
VAFRLPLPRAACCTRLLLRLDAVTPPAGGDELAVVDCFGASASGGCDTLRVMRLSGAAGTSGVLESAAVACVGEALVSGLTTGTR